MKFDNVNESFNYWNQRTIEEMEERSAEIKGIIDSDPNADILSLNVEIDGLAEALSNKKEKAQEQKEPTESTQRSLNPITSLNLENTHSETPENITSSKTYRNAFFKNLLGREMTLKEKAIFRQAQNEFRANSYNASTDSSAVLPTQTLNEVISKARKEGGLMSIVRAFNIPSGISIPVGTPTDKAKWNTEGKEVESEKATLNSVKFDAYEIIKVFSISNKVKTMSIPAFESYLTDELSNCVMATLADGLVTGTGIEQGTGLLTGIVWNKTNSFKTKSDCVEYTDITRLVSMLKRGYSNGSYFVMNNATLYQFVYGIVDNNKRPIFVIDPKDETIGMLLGFPVVVDDFLPDNTIIFGNPQYMAYNLPQGIAVESSTQSSFRSGRVDYRAMAIADCKPVIEEAFVKLDIRTSDEMNVSLTTGKETKPETIEGVSVAYEVVDNKVNLKFTGLDGKLFSQKVTDSKAVRVKEGNDTYTSQKGEDEITLTFYDDLEGGTYNIEAMVSDNNISFKCVSKMPLTVAQKVSKVNGTPILIGVD